MNKFPPRFHQGFLAPHNVSYIPDGERHREIRKHSSNTRTTIGDIRFPALATGHPLGNNKFPLSFLKGC